MDVFNKAVSKNKSLRYKLLLVFSLMSIIPLLACMYIISLYVFPQLDSLSNVSLVTLLAILISLLGFLSGRKLINPVIEMAIEARMIAGGQYDKSLEVSEDDEVGNIAASINTMTQKIKTNLDELKSYGQKMKEINTDVHKKVLALSSLLQIGDIISSGPVQLEPVLEMAMGKVAMLFESSFGILYIAKDDESDFIPRTYYGQGAERLREIILKRNGRGLLEQALAGRSTLVVDSSSKLSRDMEAFQAARNVKNIIALPIYSGRKDFGIFLIGSALDDYKYRDEDIELAKVFAKQITIAIESDFLSRKTKELAIKDDLTDLYNKNFILDRLGEEIKRAIFYQRPCSFVVFGMDNFASFRDSRGELEAEEALKKIAKVIKDNTTPIGKAARIAGEEFAILLPEKNKNESFAISEEIRRKIESMDFMKSANSALKISVGLSENPLDGATSAELFKKAVDLLGQNKKEMYGPRHK